MHYDIIVEVYVSTGHPLKYNTFRQIVKENLESVDQHPHISVYTVYERVVLQQLRLQGIE